MSEVQMPKTMQVTVFNEDEKMKTRKRKIVGEESKSGQEAINESKKGGKHQWKFLDLK